MNAIRKWKECCGGSGVLAWLTLAVAGVWIIMAAASLLHFDGFFSAWLTLPARPWVFITRPWTIVTYMFVHFDFLHMLFNAAWLYWFGRILLISLQDRHLAYFFIGGGIAGGVFFIVASALGHGGASLCGASAAVIAVMCGAAVRMPDHRISLLLIGEVKLKWVALACCALTFLGGGGSQSAHIGGLVWGTANAILINRGFDPTARIRKLTLRRKSPVCADGRRRDPAAMAETLRKRLDDMQRLDMLLDKIRISGYESLSARERRELNDLSKRIKR
ncbi:MAG: rhomboid family intramembrane serine protease [Muribaculaceae bacterium]|nr:rhomboid family intramembrane serine protease [Muribaculaceae bacterium]